MTPNGRTSQTERITTSSSTATTEVAPSSSVFLRAASTYWPKLCTGLPTLTTPMISPPPAARHVVHRRGDVHHRGARIAFDVGVVRAP